MKSLVSIKMRGTLIDKTNKKKNINRSKYSEVDMGVYLSDRAWDRLGSKLRTEGQCIYRRNLRAESKTPILLGFPFYNLPPLNKVQAGDTCP